MEVTFVRLIFWLCIKFSFWGYSDFNEECIVVREQQEVKSAAFNQNLFDLNSLFGDPPPPPPLSGIQFDKFCWRNSKEIFPFLSSSGAAGQTVSSTKQFVLNSRISFLVINMKSFCCRNMNSPLTNYGASLLCREIAFWYFTEGCKWIVIMKAFETETETITDSESHLISRRYHHRHCWSWTRRNKGGGTFIQ